MFLAATFVRSTKRFQSIEQSLCNSRASCFIADGQFGAYMQVGIQNDGPVTITVDTASSVRMHKFVRLSVKLGAVYIIYWLVVKR